MPFGPSSGPLSATGHAQQSGAEQPNLPRGWAGTDEGLPLRPTAYGHLAAPAPQERTELQYRVVGHAIGLGWPLERVQIID